MRWLISLIALWFVIGPTGASADIVRSCIGSLEGAAFLASINGEGTCKRKAKANECRERAHDAIVACAKALFEVRNEGTVLPTSCKGGRGERSAVLQWDQIIQGIRSNNLGDRVRWNECCRGPASNRQGSTNLFIRVSGDKGCGSRISAKSFQSALNIGTIHFDCQKVVMRLCPPPQRAAPKPPPRAGSEKE